MKIKAILFLLMCMSFTAQASEPVSQICGSEEVTVGTFTTLYPGELRGQVALYGAGELIEADYCTLGVDETFAPYIQNPENVVGACVLITTNGGDGTLAVFRKTEAGSYQAEIKYASVEEPSNEAGKFYDCQ